jgi:hypothetical protein
MISKLRETQEDLESKNDNLEALKQKSKERILDLESKNATKERIMEEDIRAKNEGLLLYQVHVVDSMCSKMQTGKICGFNQVCGGNFKSIKCQNRSQ